MHQQSGSDAAVDDAYRVLPRVQHRLEGLQIPRQHLRRALSVGAGIVLRVLTPRLKRGVVLQLGIALHLKVAEVHLPQTRQLCVRHVAVQRTDGLLRPQKAAGVIPRRRGVHAGLGTLGQHLQRIRQDGDIRRAVVQVVPASGGVAVPQ